MSEYVFKLPDLGEGTVEAEIAEWNVNVGDLVAEEEIVGSMMTDKAAVEVSSPVGGRVKSLAGEPGDIVAVGAPLVIFETDASIDDNDGSKAAVSAAAEQAHSVAATTATPAAVAQPRSLGNGKIVTSPAIRRRAREAGVDLGRVPGSGPRGRIVRKDFDAFLGQAGALHTHDAGKRHAATEEIKIIGLRRMIAERMTEAKRTIPHFAYVEEVDITELEKLRVHLNDSRDETATRITLLPLIAMALMRSLQRFPQCNALHDAERNVIVRHAAVHLGIATQTPDGLKVPVVRHADSLSLAKLAAEIGRLAGAARDNSARRNELSGSTITITSLGKLGGIVTTPVINAPEVAIIGVNKALRRPVVVDDQIVVRLMMNLSSSFDHRFVDGYDAAEMIQYMKSLLEHPATIFMGE